jgi:alpha-ketoglutarate-dependent taurine dioxygenase
LENGSGATMIRGFPRTKYSQDEAERIFFGVMSHVGTAVSQSAKGERIFHVRDEGFGENDPKARGPNTAKGLSFHTDRCDVITFLCLQQAKAGGENQVVSSPALYNEILHRRPELLAELVKPFYYKRHNVDTANQRSYCQQPIFSLHDGYFAANLLRVLIDRAYSMPDVPDMTPLQLEALDFVQEVAEEESMHVTFRQVEGDILLLNNWVTLHRRSAFEDHQELERRRHLLRIWLSVPNSRPLDPAFEANYGATAAGAIRGGMRPV